MPQNKITNFFAKKCDGNGLLPVLPTFTSRSPLKKSPVKIPKDKPEFFTQKPNYSKFEETYDQDINDYNPVKNNYDAVRDAVWSFGQCVPYAALAKTLECIEEESSRLKIIDTISNFLESVIALTPSDIIPTLYLCSNCIAPAYQGKELGVGETVILKLIADNTGRPLSAIKQDIKTKGDIGIVAQSSKTTQTTMFKTKRRLTIQKVFQTFREISEISGTTSSTKKLNKIKELFVYSEGSESRYIVRFVIGKMRIGLAQQSLLTAIAQAFTKASNGSKTKKSTIDQNVANLKAAFNECPSYDIIVPLILEHGIENLPKLCKMQPGIPVKPMLAQPTKGDLSDLFARFETKPNAKGSPKKSPKKSAKSKQTIKDDDDDVEEKCHETVEQSHNNEEAVLVEPLTFEWKYDGERAQIHFCKDGTFKIYSRNQEDTTSKYPDLIEKFAPSIEEVQTSTNSPQKSSPSNTKKDHLTNGHIGAVKIFDRLKVTDFILDSEVVAWDPVKKHILPFQILTTRKRKDAVSEDITVQVCVFAFDLIYLNGEPLNHLTLKKRRQILHENFAPSKDHFEYAAHLDIYTSGQRDIDDIAEFLDSSIKGNCEGLMVKNLNSLYEIDKRSKEWLKLKKDYLDTTGDTFDLVIIGAYEGKGKRTGVYGGLLLACYDDIHEQYQTICKLGTGFKDADLEELKNKLEPLKLDQKQPKSYFLAGDSPVNWPDVWFEPVLVCEVKAADLSISPAHKAAIGLVDDSRGISLRFPRYIKLRHDKKADQATTASEVARAYNEQEQIKNKNARAEEPNTKKSAKNQKRSQLDGSDESE